MRRVVDPACSREALYHPERVATFLASRPPQAAIAARPDAGSAAWLAGLAHAAYHPPPALSAILARQGCSLELQAETAGIRAFICRNTWQRFCVFCGTRPDEHRNLISDADARRLPQPGGGMAHRGFAEALAVMLPHLVPALADSALPLIAVGHSLGAALAQLLALHTSCLSAIGFGAPRIGDQALADRFRGQTSWRFQLSCDLVGHLPPAGLGWRHAGRCLLINGRSIISDPGPTTLRRIQLLRSLRYAASMPWAHRDQVLIPQLADHSIVAYHHALGRHPQAITAALTTSA